MPRRHRRGNVSAQGTPQRLVSDTFARDIENSATWNVAVHLLCDYFELPDLSTRSGLKKIHEDFDNIYRKLDRAYSSENNPKMMGGIVGIWAKMSADALLRDKLFKKGFLAKLMPLLDIPLTRHVALQALSEVTHHGGLESRQDIARQAPRLVRLMEEFPDDIKLLELCIVTLGHSVGNVLDTYDTTIPNVVTSSDMRKILEITTRSIKQPTASYYMFDHALSLLSGATCRFQEECKATPAMLSLCVACLRSTNICMRGTAMDALIRVQFSGSETEGAVVDLRMLMTPDGKQRRWPDHLVDVLMDYGFSRCETIIYLNTMREYQATMMGFLQARDPRALGRTLAGFITRTAYGIGDGGYGVQDEQTGRLTITDLRAQDMGLPFIHWQDALLHCARVLRETGVPADLDAADILEIRYHIKRNRIQDAIKAGQAALARNPQLAYAYYPIGVAPEQEAGLRATKKGLKCAQTTPFVRRVLLRRAVEHAAQLGFATMRAAGSSGERYAEAVAFLISAYEDAKAFVAEAPPDSLRLGRVLHWLVLLTLTIRGPELDANLRELQPILEKIAFSEQCATFLGNVPKPSSVRLARELILRLYPGAQAEWADILARFDALGAAPRVDAEKAEDDLAAWLEHLHVGDGENGEAHGPRRWTHPLIRTNSVELYRCSWCRNPSAALRRCGRCGKTRYCDGACQKAHWGEHKAACKTP
ncbi:hypothetical protein CERSUDRAFT_122273 [Gelatoporia subvermispora B]|uniref:MYND-type domain-containing protein n=1 Tax=Ceriporiopsis subvermispora (strain B) TaxID=914234 RepID=M2RMX0_CERS8|nr:hypothetical protein CERSUDRAFT_122273 [Gelatoporia subvermispora B]